MRDRTRETADGGARCQVAIGEDEEEEEEDSLDVGQRDNDCRVRHRMSGRKDRGKWVRSETNAGREESGETAEKRSEDPSLALSSRVVR